MADAPKFTPGPWEVDEELYDHDWAIDAPKWGALARVVADIDDDGSGKSFTRSEQGRANACLIAAAPEMYARLEKIAKWLEGNAKVHEDYAARGREFKSLRDDSLRDAKNYRVTAADIRKLLAKASGN